MRDHILSTIPYPVRIVVGLLIYRKVSQTLYGQGTARLSADERRLFRQQIWESINMLLTAARSNVAAGDHAAPFWLLGRNAPSEADFVLFGFVVSVLICEAYVCCHRQSSVTVLLILFRSLESQKVVRSFPIILDYARRIHDRYFPDYPRWADEVFTLTLTNKFAQN